MGREGVLLGRRTPPPAPLVPLPGKSGGGDSWRILCPRLHLQGRGRSRASVVKEAPPPAPLVPLPSKSRGGNLGRIMAHPLSSPAFAGEGDRRRRWRGVLGATIFAGIPQRRRSTRLRGCPARRWREIAACGCLAGPAMHLGERPDEDWNRARELGRQFRLRARLHNRRSRGCRLRADAGGETSNLRDEPLAHSRGGALEESSAFAALARVRYSQKPLHHPGSGPGWSPSPRNRGEEIKRGHARLLSSPAFAGEGNHEVVEGPLRRASTQSTIARPLAFSSG